MGDNPYSWDDEAPQCRRRKTQREIEEDRERELEQEFIQEAERERRTDILLADADDYDLAFENWKWWRAKKSIRSVGRGIRAT